MSDHDMPNHGYTREARAAEIVAGLAELGTGGTPAFIRGYNAGYDDAVQHAKEGLFAAIEPVDGLRLDEAWAEAEAALPVGGRLHLQQRAGEEETEMPDGQKWVARQGRPAGAYEAWATNRSESLGFAYGDSPVVVLHALAARLRATPPGPAAPPGEAP